MRTNIAIAKPPIFTHEGAKYVYIDGWSEAVVDYITAYEHAFGELA